MCIATDFPAWRSQGGASHGNPSRGPTSPALRRKRRGSGPGWPWRAWRCVGRRPAEATTRRVAPSLRPRNGRFSIPRPERGGRKSSTELWWLPMRRPPLRSAPEHGRTKRVFDIDSCGTSAEAVSPTIFQTLLPSCWLWMKKALAPCRMEANAETPEIGIAYVPNSVPWSKRLDARLGESCPGHGFLLVIELQTRENSW